MAALGNSSQLGDCSKPGKVKLIANSRGQSVRRYRTERHSSQLHIVQDSPGGVASVQIENMSVAIFSLPLDGVIIREK